MDAMGHLVCRPGLSAWRQSPPGRGIVGSAANAFRSAGDHSLYLDRRGRALDLKLVGRRDPKANPALAALANCRAGRSDFRRATAAVPGLAGSFGTRQ